MDINRQIIVFSIMLVSIVCLYTFNHIILYFDFKWHHHKTINQLFQFQLLALILAFTVLFIILKLEPSSKQYLHLGSLNVIASKAIYLGINGKSSWLSNGLQLLLFISIATFSFMYFNQTKSLPMIQLNWNLLPYVILFALTNSFSEEMIFRFGIIGGLNSIYSPFVISIISALLFGLPHYYGNPNGWLGVLMATFLGFVLSKASIETNGLGLAWLIHFFQDVVIYMFLFGIKK